MTGDNNTSMEAIAESLKEIKVDLSLLKEVPSDIQGLKMTLYLLVDENTEGKKKIKDLEDRVDSIEKTICKFENHRTILDSYKDKCIKLEAYTRRNNLIIKSLKPKRTDKSGELESDCINLVYDFLVTVLHITDARSSIRIDRAHRLVQQPNLNNRIPAMITKFCDFQSRKCVWETKR